MKADSDAAATGNAELLSSIIAFLRPVNCIVDSPPSNICIVMPQGIVWYQAVMPQGIVWYQAVMPRGIGRYQAVMPRLVSGVNASRHRSPLTL